MSDAFDVIRQWGDPALREQARPIEDFDAALTEQVEELKQVMLGAEGAGLAATQVGVLRRLFVYRVGDEAPRVVVNPEIVESAEQTDTALEGCLSLGKATVLVEVERPVAVTVHAQDVTGEPLTIEAEGMHARILQHEIDHLDGVLILDRTSRDQRKQAMRAMREAMAGHPTDPPPAVSA